MTQKRNRKSHAQNLKNTYVKYSQRIFALPAIQAKLVLCTVVSVL